MKKFLYIVVSIIWVSIWFVWAQSISFEPQWNWAFWYGCKVPIDVFINTNWQEISAIDLIMESSMDYVDFVPSDFVPYFLKPIVKENGLIHIVWFTVDPSERVNWVWKIWTIYFAQKQWDIDWIVRLYFLWEWDTSDTNLSIAWWVDVLRNVWQASVSFSKDLPSCITGNGNIISNESVQAQDKIDGWFADLTYDEVLESTMKTIGKNYGVLSFSQILLHNLLWIFLIFILLIILILLLKRKKDKWNKNVIKK